MSIAHTIPETEISTKPKLHIVENLTELEQNPNMIRGSFLHDGYLGLLADSLDDIEGLRIATENRHRALTRNVADKDGNVRGLGFTEDQPETATVKAMLDDITLLEKNAIKTLEKHLKKSKFYPWVKRNRGIGAKQAARLISSLGDPYWNDGPVRDEKGEVVRNADNEIVRLERPRTVSELWAYAGYSVINGSAQRRAKGEKSNWSPKAKMRAYLVAQSCVKQVANEEKGIEAGHYRKVYDAARAHHAEAIHTVECFRCGPKGKPAQPGSELSDGHKHARALRAISKEILKDLWLEARALHNPETSN